MSKELITIGRKEYISFPDLGLEKVQAKVDTGAYRSSIHCSRVRELSDENGSFLKVRFLEKDHPNYSKEGSVFREYKKVEVKSSNGQKETRFMVNKKVRIGKKIFKTDFTLTDRSAMKSPVLLGRKCLNQRFLVDVSKSYLH